MLHFRDVTQLLLGSLLAAVAFGQSTSSLRGTVYDKSGAVVPKGSESGWLRRRWHRPR